MTSQRDDVPRIAQEQAAALREAASDFQATVRRLEVQLNAARTVKGIMIADAERLREKIAAFRKRDGEIITAQSVHSPDLTVAVEAGARAMRDRIVADISPRSGVHLPGWDDLGPIEKQSTREAVLHIVTAALAARS